MLAIVEYHSGGACAQKERVLGGVRFCVAAVREGNRPLARLSAQRAARGLRRLGVRTAVFPQNYPFLGVFARSGVLPPNVEELNRAAALPAVRRALLQLGVEPSRAHVVLAAPCVSGDVRALALSLCGEVRYLSLRVLHGGEQLARELLHARGVALGRETDGACLTVAFGDAQAAGAVLRLDAEPRIEYESEYPPEVLASLWSAGMLRASELKVKWVDLDKKAPKSDGIE